MRQEYIHEPNGAEYGGWGPLTQSPCAHHRARKVLRWNGVVGIAENAYPHPKGWTLIHLYDGSTLDKIQIKHLTAAFLEPLTSLPNCQEAWEISLGLGP